MRYGTLQRRITLERQVKTQNTLGEEIISWQEVATVAAEKVELRGLERYAAAQYTGSAIRTFRFRWRADLEEITSTHRVIFDGRPFNITDVREAPGRRRGIEVDCYAQSERPLVNGP